MCSNTIHRPWQQEFPFQTLEMQHNEYKLFGVVTNRDLPGNDLITWHRTRYSDSGKVHSIQKQDLVGGQFPSNLFGANVAWWKIMIIAFNLNIMMNNLALPKSLKKND